MLEIEQKEIEEEKREQYLIFSREICLDLGFGVIGKPFCFEQLFLTHMLAECAEQITPPPPQTALLKSELSRLSLLTCERDLSIFIWALCTSLDTNTFQMLRYKTTT